MSSFTLTLRVEAPGLETALNNLADVIKGTPAVSQQIANPTQPVQNVPAIAAPITPTVSNTVAPEAVPTNVATTAPTADVTPAAPSVEVPSTAPSAEPAAGKVYSFDDITAAGSQLLEMGKMNDLITLLKGFGVQAVNMLKPEQYPAVADGLRKLGAKI